jgi:hypothetical protein
MTQFKNSIHSSFIENNLFKGQRDPVKSARPPHPPAGRVQGVRKKNPRISRTRNQRNSGNISKSLETEGNNRNQSLENISSEVKSIKKPQKNDGEIFLQSMIPRLEVMHAVTRADLKHNSKACPPSTYYPPEPTCYGHYYNRNLCGDYVQLVNRFS